MTINVFNAVLQVWARDYVILARQVRHDESMAVVHDFRVASRHLLTIEPLLRRVTETGYWRHRAHYWLKHLNTVRDLQVLRVRFGDNADLQSLCEEEVQQSLGQWRHVRKRVGRKVFRKKLRTSLRQVQDEVTGRPEWYPQALAGQWGQTVNRVRRAMSQVDRRQPGMLHRLRVRYKTLRYWLEFLQEALLIEQQDAAMMKYWQDQLGEIHDLEVALVWLERRRPGEPLRSFLVEDLQRRQQLFFQEQVNFERFVAAMNDAVVAALGGCSHP